MDDKTFHQHFGGPSPGMLQTPTAPRGPATPTGGNFIKGAIKHPGALHQQLGIPQSQTIPAARLAKAAHAGGKLGERARFAETLKKIR